MDKYAVIGHPIKHSLSPVMHNAGFAELNIDANYEAIEVEPDKLVEFAKFAKDNLKGFNVTVPHKQRIIPFLDEIDKTAELANSVNTVVVENGKLKGYTTDGYGLEKGIELAFNIQIKDNSFFFIGCGGAVQAVAYHFAMQGAKNLFFANRTLKTAENLLSSLKSNFPLLGGYVCELGNKRMESFSISSKVLIQGTSLGLNEDDPIPVNLDNLNEIAVYDTIYKKTAIQTATLAKGWNCSDGRSMLLHQGAKAFSIWTGQDAPIKTMQNALYSAIDK